MADRYFVETPIAQDRVLLGGSEAHHLIHVMRAKQGSRVVLFDGSVAEFSARVERIARSEVELAVLSRAEVDRELPLELILGVALPKGDRQKWLVEKAVELGVARIVPLKTSRSVAQPVRQALDRLRRSVIEASKQCGRTRLMEIARPRAWADFVTETAEAPSRLLAHPGLKRGHSTFPFSFAPLRTPKTSEKVECPHFLPSPVLLAVGPEGGFTGEEVSLAIAAGWKPIDLGKRILRVETAAILLVAMVTHPYAV